MAVQTAIASNPLITTIVTDIDADITVEVVASGNKMLYAVEISNPNTNEAVYIHIINAASGQTTADQHNTQLYCPANTTMYYYSMVGYKTDTGISYYCSTSAGGGQSATGPTKDVEVKFGFTAR